MTDPGKTQRISAERMRELIRQCKETDAGSPRLVATAEVIPNGPGRPSINVELSAVDTPLPGAGSQKEGEA